MRLHLLAAATTLTLALAGCASSGSLHPNGTPIDPSSLSADHSLAGLPLSPAAWPSVDWWTGLGDPQLDALIAEALQGNPALAVADARAREAQAEAGLADAARGPVVDAGVSVTAARLPAAIPLGNGHTAVAKYADVSLNWGLDLWGGKRAAWEAALGASRAADVEARATRIALSGNVARAYAGLGYAFTRQDLATAELQRAEQVRELTRQRLVAGIDSRLQLRQGDSEVASAQQHLAAATRGIDAARSSLSVLLGKGPDRGLDIARPRLLKPAELTVPTQLPVALLGRRADLVAARWRVEAAAREIRAAKSEFLPNVSIGAMAGVIALGGGNLFSLPSRFYEAGPSISLPIFDGGRLRANLAGKDAQFELAAAQYNQTLIGALNQIADDISALRSLQQQLAAQQQALEAADSAWQLAQQRYRAGIGSYLEALAVRQQLLLAEQGLAALQLQQVDFSVQLIQALGGGFQPQAAGTTPSPPSTASRS